MLVNQPTCQDHSIRWAGLPVSRIRVLAGRAAEQLRQRGPSEAVAKILSYLVRWTRDAIGVQRVRRAAEETGEEILNLWPGETVEVKSNEEIRRTLDSGDRTRGLGFMPGMARHCGKRYRVYKRAQTIILEGSDEVRRLKNTVLLEGVLCDGEHLVCDRSCFYFWKESWLRRVSREGTLEGPERSSEAVAASGVQRRRSTETLEP